MSGFSAKVICDSISPANVRLTTFEVVFPRFMLSQFNTYRTFSRNSASSRARPVAKVIEQVKNYPFIPTHWGKNKPGMSASEELLEIEKEDGIRIWLEARDFALESAEKLMKIGVHKQITNRLLEPFVWQTVLVSATEWENAFAQRDHEAAQPEFQLVVQLMKKALTESIPKYIDYDQWHLPFIRDEEFANEKKNIEEWKQVSAARSCRVSYENHNGIKNFDEDIKLCKKLSSEFHMSPLEHQATPLRPKHPYDDVSQTFCGNFRGWKQYRKEFAHEDNFKKAMELK